MPQQSRVTMPQLGESVHEGTISKWLVQPGERVEEFEPLLEVDTDKVNAEVPSPVTGVLREILAAEGATVEAGAEIAVVEVDGDGEGSGHAAAAAEPHVMADVGAGPGGPAPSASDGSTAAPRSTEPAPRPAASTEPARERADDGQRRYSPAVLLLAQENELDLTRVHGTGLNGRVTKRDVRQFLAAEGAPAAAPGPAETAPTPAAAPAPAATPATAAPSASPAAKIDAGQGDEAVPLTRIRRLIGENMVTSKTTIPHAWQTQEADMSGIVANRNRQKRAFADREGFSLTFLPYVLAAAVAGLRENPHVNATFNGDEILVHRHLNLGITVGLEDTLVVPVIRDADSLSIAGLARAVNDLATRAKAKKLKADDLAGGTFTVNNSGTFGTIFSYSVINPGQAAILTMEAIQERPVAVNGMLGIKPMMYVCFSFDHRVLDGLQAARYIVSVRKWLESVTAETPIY
jgi:2-oxoisovalerate dehydrogenase E2 component (dihydrolipoyl transacylase)